MKAMRRRPLQKNRNSQTKTGLCQFLFLGQLNFVIVIPIYIMDSCLQYPQCLSPVLRLCSFIRLVESDLVTRSQSLLLYNLTFGDIKRMSLSYRLKDKRIL